MSVQTVDGAVHRQHASDRAYRALWALVDEMSMTQAPAERTLLRWAGLAEGIGATLREGVTSDPPL